MLLRFSEYVVITMAPYMALSRRFVAELPADLKGGFVDLRIIESEIAYRKGRTYDGEPVVCVCVKSPADKRVGNGVGAYPIVTFGDPTMEFVDISCDESLAATETVKEGYERYCAEGRDNHPVVQGWLERRK